ncbi:EamA family transporter [Streptomyces sp. AC536]|uniref:EamA family transporter n=1 Tax=Streptomyces buecherae TaxID=2763006 RepID=UPI00164DEC39|nr:EamA family transporter [Streptomyces buecherae]MBC3984045.1 EamA family transporter [Streptomyces buecherae]QNJ42122.1 EamA family transporter [Streptomyces buecherae]
MTDVRAPAPTADASVSGPESPAPAVPVDPAAPTGPAGAGRGERAAGWVGVGLVAGGICSQQFGAAVAASLFPRVGALGVVSLRLALSALVLLLVCRPAVRGYGRADWAVVAGFGVALAGMNTLIYQAIDRIPLGTAVTLEVLGPLALSVVTARGPGRWLWAGLALAGVALLGRGGFGELHAAGAGCALGAGALWAAYILLSARAGSRFPRVDGLAWAMACGALLSLPLGVASAGGALLDPAALALGGAVALLSSVLPYTLELLSLRRLAPAAFSVLMSLSPAVAALAGYLVLHQGLALPEVAAIALVVAASAGAVRTATSPAPVPATKRGTRPRTAPRSGSGSGSRTG